MDPLILDLGTHVGPSLVREHYLDLHPPVAEALTRARARLITFEPKFGARDFLAALRDAMDAAVCAVPGDTLPVLVAVVGLPDLLAVCDRPRSTATQLAIPAMTCSRGVFVGYIALAEGGVLFVTAGGLRREPTPEEFISLLERAPR